jgi:ornithine--oxo-acid transaminase
LLAAGILTKETRETVIRLAPPLCIERSELDWAVERIAQVVAEAERARAS